MPLTFEARKLPQKLTPSGWLSVLQPRRENPPLDGNQSADVAIIGAGFAGLAAATRLAERDATLKIVVLDVLAIAEGSSGRNSGFMIDLPHDISSETFSDSEQSGSRREIALNRMAIEFAHGLAQRHGWGKEIIDACGKYSFSTGRYGDTHLAEFADQLKSLGEDHTRLTAQDANRITGSSFFTSGLFTPGCSIIQPAAYIRALAASLPSTVRVFERTPALSFMQSTGGWYIKTPSGAVMAGKVILCCNGHAQSFGLFPNQLLHVFTYSSLSEEFAPSKLGGERVWGSTPAHPMGTTMRRVPGKAGDRLLIRSKYSFNPSLEVSAQQIAKAGRLHDRKFAQRFPMLNGVKMQYRWAGALALTWNSVPAFGEIERNLFSACACNGVGLTKATLSGLAAAEQVLGVTSDLVTRFHAMAKPKPLPPSLLTSIGARTTIAFRRWHAGRE